MSQVFEQQLARIRDALVDMSRVAEDNLMLALDALRERNPVKADAAEAADTRLDQMEIELDEMVVTYMATHGPVASDCRLMLVVGKLNTNLERVGDLAVTVARRARELAREPVFQPFPELQRMGDLALAMLRDAIACFISGEYELAIDIIRRDKAVDEIKHRLSDQLLAIMTTDATMIVRGAKLIEIARSLERIADHAKSIAEQVYYLFKARDIRHERP